MIEIKVNGAKFETDSPLKAFAFATAIEFYDFNEKRALQVVDISHSIYIDVKHEISISRLVDQVCENIENYVANSYDAVFRHVVNAVVEYDL